MIASTRDAIGGGGIVPTKVAIGAGDGIAGIAFTIDVMPGTTAVVAVTVAGVATSSTFCVLPAV